MVYPKNLLGLKVELDLKKCIEEVKRYIEKGYSNEKIQVEEPFIADEIYPSRFLEINPKEAQVKFLSVDASSYPLMRGNNWRIGVSRCAYVIVENLNGRWVVSEEGYQDHIFSTIAPINERKYRIWTKLREYESEMAIKLVKKLDSEDFCLMDGAAFFGMRGGSSYSVELYQACLKKKIKLLMIPKNSPNLHDEKNRDLLTTINLYGLKLQREGKLGKCWFYHPILEAANRKNLYGDVTCVKLSPLSPRVFRCDIMDYLVEKGKKYLAEILSELAGLSMDARCNGYPAPLFLAHERTRIPRAKLLEYFELVQLNLDREGLLEFLLRESDVAGFRKHLLGLTYDFDMIEDIEGE